MLAMVFFPILIFVLLLGQSQALRRECAKFEECTDISKCPEWSSKVLSSLTVRQRNKLAQSICGFNEGKPMVCCSLKELDIRSVLSGSAPVSEDGCGFIFATADRVASGNDAPHPGAWPWMARLIYKENLIRPKATFCGGALITRRHVVTAAHCAETSGLGEPVEVVLGELDLRNEYDCLITEDDCGGNGTEGLQCYNEVFCADRAKKYKVKRTTLNPDYNSEGGGTGPRTFAINDVAIIELVEDVNLTNLIQPICLPDPDERDTSPARMALAGWGNTAEDPKLVVSAEILQQLNGLIEIPLKDSDAKDGFGCKTLLDLDLLSSQMCVTREKERGNSCRGDSGGPVARLRGNARGGWELAGVISFGFGHCGSTSPLVVTRIQDQKIVTWIKMVIGGLELPNSQANVANEGLVWG